MNNNEIKNKIVDSIKYAKDKLNFNLIKEDWGCKQAGEACALGCLLLANDRNLSENDENILEVSDLLGVSDQWITSFIEGFDGVDAGYNSNSLHEPVRDAYEIGKELKEQFAPKEKKIFP